MKKIVQIGDAFVNLKYLISARRMTEDEPGEFAAGDVQMMMCRGDPIRFRGPDADSAMRQLAEHAAPGPRREGTMIDPIQLDSIDGPEPPPAPEATEPGAGPSS
jgi:hypothetical protein